MDYIGQFYWDSFIETRFREKNLDTGEDRQIEPENENELEG